MSVLNANALSVGYAGKHRTKHVLEHVDLSLDKGELICLMGNNGSGNSAML